MVHTFNPALGRQRRADFWESEAILLSTASSRSSGATERSCLKRTKTNKQTNKFLSNTQKQYRVSHHCSLTKDSRFYLRSILILKNMKFMGKVKAYPQWPVFFWDRVSLWAPAWPWTPRDSPASANWKVGLQMCTTRRVLLFIFIDFNGCIVSQSTF